MSNLELLFFQTDTEDIISYSKLKKLLIETYKGLIIYLIFVGYLIKEEICDILI